MSQPTKPLTLTQAEAAELHRAGRVERRRKVVPAPVGQPWFWEGDEVSPKPQWFDGYESLERDTCGASKHEVNRPMNPPHATGTECWVKEPWAPYEYCYEGYRVEYLPPCRIDYLADYPNGKLSGDKYRPSTHMPRWASRSTARCAAVDVRLVDGVWMWCEVWERMQ